jgi:hypothetical protein
MNSSNFKIILYCVDIPALLAYRIFIGETSGCQVGGGVYAGYKLLSATLEC